MLVVKRPFLHFWGLQNAESLNDLDSSTLILSIIWVTEKFCNFTIWFHEQFSISRNLCLTLNCNIVLTNFPTIVMPVLSFWDLFLRIFSFSQLQALEYFWLVRLRIHLNIDWTKSLLVLNYSMYNNAFTKNTQ